MILQHKHQRRLFPALLALLLGVAWIGLLSVNTTLAQPRRGGGGPPSGARPSGGGSRPSYSRPLSTPQPPSYRPPAMPARPMPTTDRPTTRPTAAPTTNRPTTTRPTTRPATPPPTNRPTTRPTAAPTTNRPTTTRPTTRPATPPPTNRPTTRPTTRPDGSGRDGTTRPTFPSRPSGDRDGQRPPGRPGDGDRNGRPGTPGRPGDGRDGRPDHRRPPSYKPVPPSTIKHVRSHFHGYKNYWTADWYRHHPHAWHPYRIPAYRWWYRPSWASTWGWFGVGFFAGAVVNEILDPYPYNYGTNIVYRGDMVYVNGVPYVSSAEYYRQAAELARTVQPIVIQNTIEVPVAEDSTPALAPPEPQADEESEWMPMGSFAVLKADETTEDFNEEVSTVMQLATNKKGEIRGNYFMADGDTARQIVGAVDSKSQRVAMRFADDENTVMECGLWNLTQDSVPLLVHFDAEDTEQMTLIRLSDPEDEEQNGPVLPEN